MTSLRALTYLSIYLASALPLPAQIIGPEWHSGLPHSPLGAAMLQIQPSTQGPVLMVSNIMSSGMDGVAVDLGQAGGLEMHLLGDLLPGSAPAGAFVMFEAVGEVAGAIQPLGGLKITKSMTCDTTVEVMNGATGALTYDLFGQLGPCPVAEVLGVSSLVAAQIFGCPGESALIAERSSSGELMLALRLAQPMMMSLAGQSNVTCDTLRVHTGPQSGEAISEVRFLAADISTLTIGSEHLGFFDICYEILSPARYDTLACGAPSTPCLRVYNLDQGPPMVPEVVVPLGDSPGLEMTWSDLDPMGTLPAGTSLSFETRGLLGTMPNQLHDVTTYAKNAGGWMVTHDFTPMMMSVSLDVEVLLGTSPLLLVPGIMTTNYDYDAMDRITGFAARIEPGDQIPPFRTGFHVLESRWDMPTTVTLMVGGTAVSLQADTVRLTAAASVPVGLSEIGFRVDGLSEITFTSAALRDPPLALSVIQNPTTLATTISVMHGPPGAPLFLVHSFDPANSSSPGTGIWNGLHIDPITLLVELQQSLMGNPLFGGLLDPCGRHTFVIPGSILPAGLMSWSNGLVVPPGSGPVWTGIVEHTFM